MILLASKIEKQFGVCREWPVIGSDHGLERVGILTQFAHRLEDSVAIGDSLGFGIAVQVGCCLDL
jgi:hypothetical protein